MHACRPSHSRAHLVVLQGKRNELWKSAEASEGRLCSELCRAGSCAGDHRRNFLRSCAASCRESSNPERPVDLQPGREGFHSEKFGPCSLRFLRSAPFFFYTQINTDRSRRGTAISVHTAYVATWDPIRQQGCERASSECPEQICSIACFIRLFTSNLFFWRGRPRGLFPASAGAEARGFFLENTRLSLCGFFEEGLFCEVVS